MGDDLRRRPGRRSSIAAQAVLALMLGALIVVARPGPAAAACDCLPLTATQAYNRATAVFLGTIGDVTNGKAKVQVKDTYKGDVQSKVTVDGGTDSCAWAMRSGDTTLFYVEQDGPFSYKTSKCTGNRPESIAQLPPPGAPDLVRPRLIGAAVTAGVALIIAFIWWRRSRRRRRAQAA